MRTKNKSFLLVKRLIIWLIYLISGIILYLKEGYLFNFLITFAKVIYPLSIFWLQSRIKSRGKFLSIDSSMSTSQLWFNILPVLASLITVILTILNSILYITFFII